MLPSQESPHPRNDEEANAPEKKRSFLSHVGEILGYVLLAAIIIIPIRLFIAQPFIVSGKSMSPTFQNGEYLIVDELTKRTRGYERGEVVILRYPNNPSEFYIKRVIGLPGETVSIENGIVSITDQSGITFVLDEPYVKYPRVDNQARSLTNTEYFVMGDNRAQSSDSRLWGTVPEKLMGGKALLRLFPLNRIELFPGKVVKYTDHYEQEK